jgi:predicted nucleotidyltransferase
MANLTTELGLPYFVAGAMARDIVITHVFGMNAGQATKDVDFAVAMESWDQYEAVEKKLLARKQFEKGDAIHRLYFKHDSGVRYPLDIIPFGGLEQTPNTIAWPPELKILMNVVGYEEALATAVTVQIEPDLLVRVASLPGLALMKIFAWIDRGHGTSKDALDLRTLFRCYPQADNEARLYGDELGTLEAVGYDLDLAGPRLLGQDVRKIAKPSALRAIKEALGDANTRDRLATHMAAGLRIAVDDFATAERLLDQFTSGLEID